jgi:hypothetical protein
MSLNMRCNLVTFFAFALSIAASFTPARALVPAAPAWARSAEITGTDSTVFLESSAPALKEIASDNLKALFGGGTLEVKEYNPSLLSDYKIRITDLYVYGKRKDLKAINRVEMTVTLASRY